MLEKDGKPEKKLVAAGSPTMNRGLLLNKTNLRTLRGAFGDDTANWIGKIIVVFPTMTDVRGKLTPALRVRIPPPKQAAAAPQQPVTSGNGASAPAAGNGAAPPLRRLAAAARLPRRRWLAALAVWIRSLSLIR